MLAASLLTVLVAVSLVAVLFAFEYRAGLVAVEPVGPVASNPSASDSSRPEPQDQH